MLKYHKEHGSLEGRDGPQQLDVRMVGASLPSSRTAQKAAKAVR